MNIGKMMKDLQKMQSKMQEEMESLEIEGSAGGGVVTARMSGKKELLGLKLSPEAITPDDPELMEDLLIAAVNEAGRKVDTFAVQVWIESRTVRKDLTAYEKRQLARGYWHTVVKVRGNKDAFHVHKFDTPVYSRKVRVFLLTGYSGINEIELYGERPKRKEQ